MNAVNYVKPGDRVKFQCTATMFKAHTGTVAKTHSRTSITITDDLSKRDTTVLKSSTHVERICVDCKTPIHRSKTKCERCLAGKKPETPKADSKRKKVVYKKKPCCDCDEEFQPTGARDVRCTICKDELNDAKENGTEYIPYKDRPEAPESDDEIQDEVRKVDDRPTRFCECRDCRERFSTKDPDRILCDKCHDGVEDKLGKLCDDLAAAGRRAAGDETPQKPKKKKSKKDKIPNWVGKPLPKKGVPPDTRKAIVEDIPAALSNISKASRTVLQDMLNDVLVKREALRKAQQEYDAANDKLLSAVIVSASEV